MRGLLIIQMLLSFIFDLIFLFAGYLFFISFPYCFKLWGAYPTRSCALLSFAIAPQSVVLACSL